LKYVRAYKTVRLRKGQTVVNKNLDSSKPMTLIDWLKMNAFH